MFELANMPVAQPVPPAAYFLRQRQRQRRDASSADLRIRTDRPSCTTSSSSSAIQRHAVRSDTQVPVRDIVGGRAAGRPRRTAAGGSSFRQRLGRRDPLPHAGNRLASQAAWRLGEQGGAVRPQQGRGGHDVSGGEERLGLRMRRGCAPRASLRIVIQRAALIHNRLLSAATGGGGSSPRAERRARSARHRPRCREGCPSSLGTMLRRPPRRAGEGRAASAPGAASPGSRPCPRSSLLSCSSRSPISASWGLIGLPRSKRT